MKTMKSLVLPLVLIYVTFVSAAYAAAGETPHVNRAQMEITEKSLDAALQRLTPDSTSTLIGPSRGVHLEGVGVVLTAEVILVNAQVSIMHPLPTKEEIVQMRKTKLARVPQLKKVLKDALVSAAGSLDAIPPDEQIVIAVIIPRFSFEDAAGIPVQVTVQASKRKLLESKGAALDAVIKITED
jgi:hypothetical protein